MSNRSRLGLVALAVAVAVVAFVVLSPGDTDEDADDPGDRAAQTTQTTEEQAAPIATAPSAPPAAADEIVVKGGKPEGGVQRIVVTKGDTVRLLVSSDGSDDFHLHGYDIEREASPAKPASFRFKANVEGVFEIESHTAEDAGLEPLIGRLVVEPG